MQNHERLGRITNIEKRSFPRKLGGEANLVRGGSVERERDLQPDILPDLDAEVGDNAVGSATVVKNATKKSGQTSVSQPRMESRSAGAGRQGSRQRQMQRQRATRARVNTHAASDGAATVEH